MKTENEFGKPTEITSVRVTLEVNLLLKEAKKYIDKKNDIKISYSNIISVLVKKYLDSEGIK
jgi:hypothetical protein